MFYTMKHYQLPPYRISLQVGLFFFFLFFEIMNLPRFHASPSGSLKILCCRNIEPAPDYAAKRRVVSDYLQVIT